MLANISATASTPPLYRPGSEETLNASQIAAQANDTAPRDAAIVRESQRVDAAPQRATPPPPQPRLNSQTGAALIEAQEARPDTSSSLADTLVQSRNQENIQRALGGNDTASDLAPPPAPTSVADEVEAVAGSSTRTSPEAAQTDTSPNTRFETRFDRPGSVANRVDETRSRSETDPLAPPERDELRPDEPAPRIADLDSNLDGAVTPEDIARSAVDVRV